jgi:predicted ATPase/signal transduction histidine kinase/CheY-like chemotaxis protein/tRNA A-37 threonylcarbamoyl transferase component Bud32
MLALPQYQVVQQLYESSHSIIYRSAREQDNQPVILKMLKEEYASPEELSRRKQEYEIITSLSHPGIIQAYGIERYQNTIILILEDFGGESLQSIMEDQRITIQDFFPLALQLADSLAYIHAADIIHKDISPNNILVNQETNQLKITDFGSASRLFHETPSLQNPELLQGTLAYLSPEQTGRINRRIDCRTDLYSMGIIFYELLTGHLPFQSLDALELVHAHIAKVPSPVYEVSPHIPRILSGIVMKLLRKNADERYQSAFGVKADLERCHNNLSKLQNKPTFSFPLGQDDMSERFQIPQKLYGREREINTLLQAFEGVCQGQKELMLVTGYSGVGKTALINEVHKPMTSKNGYFLVGKFDQFQSNTPYTGIATAYDTFCRYLLMENEEVLEKWRDKILTALGDHAQILIELIPTLELIIGPQPVVPKVEATEAKNRFTLFFLKFIESLCDKEHPIILFIDDLQWADSDSLLLLQRIIKEVKINYLFIIGSYRDNEVDKQHPLMGLLKTLKKSHAVIHIVKLHSLQPNDIEQLLRDSLGYKGKRIAPLANLIYQKTQGNCFFTHQFLQVLREEKLLNFNFEQYQWQWDIEQIAAQNITDNVVDLLSNKINSLSHESSKIMQLAACIGTSFDFLTLSKCYSRSGAEVLPVLWSAIKEGLIQPLDENYKHIDLAENASFKFSHDRIRQAAYELFPDDRKKAVHLRIGRFLLKDTPSSYLSEKIFDICWHLNQSLDRIDNPGEMIEIAHLNLQAGQKAKLAMADHVAIKYLEFSRACLPKDHWQKEYDLSLSIYQETIETLFLIGHFEQVEIIAEVILRETVTLLDKISIFEILIQLYMVKNQMDKALKTALQVLEMLGVSLEQSPPEEFSVEQLYTLGDMTAPHHIAAMRILNFAISPSYTVAPEIFPRLVFTMVRLSAHYGNSALSAFGYTNFASLLCCAFEDIETGYQTGQAGLWLLDKFPSGSLKAKVFASYFVTVHHWKRHAQETIEPLIEGSNYGLEIGDLEFAGITLMHCGSYLFWLGHPLTVVAQQYEKFSSLMQRFNLEYQLIYLNIWQQTVFNLQGKNTMPCRLQGEVFDEDEVLPTLLKKNFGMAIFGVYLAKVMLCYLFKEVDQALDNAILAERYEKANTGVMVVPIYNFYYSLVLLATLPDVSQDEQVDILRKINAHQEQMKFWAVHAPDNYQHRYALVEAEKARFLGKPEAGEWYEQSITLAEKNKYRIEEALSYELAAEYYLERGMEKIARTFFKEAHSAYAQWGATAKVLHLEKEYPYLSGYYKNIGEKSNSATSTVGSSMLHSPLQMDLTSVIKASQTLSKEIVLSKLLANMMRIVIENAGAQKGLLLLPRKNKWFIETEGYAENDDIMVLRSLALEEYSQIPSALIHYIARTQENVVLSNAAQEGSFNQDRYIIREQCKSILGMPLVNQGKLIGIIYLENNLTTDAFDQKSLEILTILSSQLAISIKNSLLYSQLEIKVAERTSALQQEITERKRAEDKATFASKAKSDFLSNMSHEFRTPLNVILGFAQILARDISIGEEQQKQVAIINRHAHHILTLINEVLDLAKIESGKATLDNINFDLDNFLESLKETFLPQAEYKGLFFTIKKDENLLRSIKTDEVKLRQIFINLIGNAFKFTKTGGISLRVRSAKSAQEAGDIQMLYCEVEDTGIGIDPEHQEKIFAPFIQSSASVDQTVGTGLGLSITRQFIELMGGDIEVTSTPDIGSTFRFKVAIEKSEHAEIKRSSRSPRVIGIAPGQKTFRLLIVEDVVENRRILVKLFNSIGFRVKEASNGAQGVEMCQNWHPDLVWMDIRMPVMDGYEATREIRKTKAGKEVIIVALTAQAFGNEQEKIFKAGCNDFINKPYSEEELFATMKKYLGVQFIYQDEDKKNINSGEKTTGFLDPESIAKLPEDARNTLLEATVNLDQESFFTVLEQLPPLHKKIAVALQALVENYRFEDVENILGRKK